MEFQLTEVAMTYNMPTHQLKIRTALPADAAIICEFIVELAAHEGRPELATITPDCLRGLLFGDRALAEAHLGYVGGKCVAFAIVAERFSSFRGTRLLYVEDMLVLREYRGGGTGKQFWAFLARRAEELGCERMEWSALDDNDVALGFYDRMEAERERGVVHFSLRGDFFENLKRFGNE